jgi:pimeloyl-ACP methyl ester carboxylesterase
MDGQRIIDVNGVKLCVDTTGDAADPAILLIGGMGASMDWWEEEFCERLASGQGQGGRFVIRYDHRDTGRSVSYPAGAPGYTGADLAADAVGVLDAFGRRSAHLAGISMGGALAQQVALAHPDRVDSLMLISTSPAVPAGPGRSELPPMSEDLRAYFAAEVKPDWAERAAVIDYLVGYERRLEGAEYFDEAHVRALVERIVDRTDDMAASMTNHALIERGEQARGPLDKIAASTLVIHGTADPLFPFGHGEALAREIPHAELMPLEGVGHQVPPRPWWTSVITAMLRGHAGGAGSPSSASSRRPARRRSRRWRGCPGRPRSASGRSWPPRTAGSA